MQKHSRRTDRKASKKKHELPHPKQARESAGLTWRGLMAAAKVGSATILRCETSGEYPANANTRAAYLAALGLTEAGAAS